MPSYTSCLKLTEPPEAYNSLKDWMDFRASYGEKITDESWVMRNIWKTAGYRDLDKLKVDCIW